MTEAIAGDYNINFRVTYSGQTEYMEHFGGGIVTTERSSPTTTPRITPVTPKVQGGQFGGQHGLDMIVPGGYPDDSYPVRATSGERVTITPAGEKTAGITIGSLTMQINKPVANGEQLYREFKRRLQEDLRAERLRA